MATLKLQSAMEYLMTYGWALLIISIVIVALVSIGVFNGSPLGTTCIASPGFTCAVQTFSQASGNLTVTIGQDSGTPWTTANVVFINASQESSVQSTGLTTAMLTPQTAGPSNNIVSGLPSGTTTTVTLSVIGAGQAHVGQGISGYIWVQYTTGSSGGAVTQAQLASVTAKAS